MSPRAPYRQNQAKAYYCRQLGQVLPGGSPVGIVVFTCPVTGDDVSTGIETDPDSFDLVDAFDVRLRCPKCGQRHDWSELNGRLVEEPQENSN